MLLYIASLRIMEGGRGEAMMVIMVTSMMMMMMY